MGLVRECARARGVLDLLVENARQAEFMKLDLGSLAQVAEFAANFKAKKLPLHLDLDLSRATLLRQAVARNGRDTWRLAEAHFDEQRRCDGKYVFTHGGQLGKPVCHKPPGTLSADNVADA